MKPEAFIEAVRRTIERYGMDLSRPLAMVSGGPDSVALLWALVELGSGPAVLHVEHGVRGEESLGDEEFVRRLCGTLGVRFEVRRLRIEGGSNFQDRARRERYRIAEEVADTLGCTVIGTGHTADDVAETVLMNLARGAGMRGLSGIPPVRGRFARPLIERRRQEILDYLESLGQPYRTDSSNLTAGYDRNRIRLEVLPVLEDMHPGAAANIARGAALTREDVEALENIAAKAVHHRAGDVFLPPEELRTMPHALRRYAVRAAYSALLPRAPRLESAAVEAVLGLCSRGEGTRTLDLPEGVVVVGRASGELVFYEGGEPAGETVEVLEGRFVFGGWGIEAREVSGFDAADAARAEVAYLAVEEGPYRVRYAREGDIIRPMGLGGTKKVLRAMMDRGVPQDLRRWTPVVVDGEGRVAWIFGGELGEEFRVGGRQKAIRLEVEKNP